MHSDVRRCHSVRSVNGGVWCARKKSSHQNVLQAGAMQLHTGSAEIRNEASGSLPHRGDKLIIFSTGVPEMVENMCPVCGYSMGEPPRDYNICASCGTEFGHHDVNASIEELRSAWLNTGPKWWSSTEPIPPSWNPLMQLANLLASLVVAGSSDEGIIVWAAPLEIGRGPLSSDRRFVEAPG